MVARIAAESRSVAASPPLGRGERPRQSPSSGIARQVEDAGLPTAERAPRSERRRRSPIHFPKARERHGFPRRNPMSSLSARARPALGALGIAALAALPCDAQTFDHRWGGLIHDAFTYDGQNVWLVEDGGRIRHSFNATSANPTWTFQTTPSQVQNTLRRIFFLSDNQTGWAVSEDGYIIETTNGGASWNVLHRMPSKLDPNDFEDLWDVHFFSANEGWVLGLHGIW
jgi:hypothetical protein